MSNSLIKLIIIVTLLITSSVVCSSPTLESVRPGKPGVIVATVNWGNMIHDKGREENFIRCNKGDCFGRTVGLIANINGKDELVPSFRTKLISRITSEREVLYLLKSASEAYYLENNPLNLFDSARKKAGKSEYHLRLPVTSDLCFKYSVGYSFEGYNFSEPNCIHRSLLKL